jgi:hypothetical protein
VPPQFFQDLVFFFKKKKIALKDFYMDWAPGNSPLPPSQRLSWAALCEARVIDIYRDLSIYVSYPISSHLALLSTLGCCFTSVIEKKKIFSSTFSIDDNGGMRILSIYDRYSRLIDMYMW